MRPRRPEQTSAATDGGNEMAGVPIAFACGLTDRTLALHTGEVKAPGIALNFLAIDDPREIFDRMGRNLEFEASEMSSSDFIRRLAQGDCPFVALPAFVSRLFRHGHIAVDRRVIRSPKDLAGKRIGVPFYPMTAAIFIRGLLQHDHGVDLSNVTWVEGSINAAKPHGQPTQLPFVRPITIEANNSGKSLSDLLDAGEIQAVIGTELPKCIKTNPNVQRLFPDFRDREKDYFRRTGIFPIMHLVVLRKDIYDAHPFVATSLYNALCDSKANAAHKMRHLGVLRAMLPWMTSEIEDTDAVFGGDPWPYGVEANRPTLDALMQYLVEQGLLDAPIPIDDLFAPIYGQEAKP
jgi:4,5-dihydroxyphthalate decarboxylase